MIEKISAHLTSLLCKENVITKDEADIYEYGCQITLANIVNFMIAAAIGILFRSLLQISIFYFCFVSLRFFCGGYHADSYRKCFSLFALTCMACVCFSGKIQVYHTVLPACFLFSDILLGLTIFFKAPVEHVNRPATPDERKIFRKKCFLIYMFWTLFGIILWRFGQKELLSGLTSTFIAVMILMFPKEGGYENVKKERL